LHDKGPQVPRKDALLKLKQGIVELYRKVSTSLPPDVEQALVRAHAREPEGSSAGEELARMVQIAQSARGRKHLLCLDTGVPVFHVRAPKSLGHREIRETIVEATREATRRIPLQANAVDALTNTNTGDNTGEGVPVIHIAQSEGSTLTVELSLMASGSENLGCLYSLPEEGLHAERNLEGVRRCVMDAVRLAGGRGCPPYTIGAGVAGTRDQAVSLSKEQLRRKLSDTNPREELRHLEERLLEDINALGIGPHGRGGKTTALGVKLGVHHRHPDSFFVDVSFACWSNRRGKLIW
jgi:fumarate hydratase class I